jgi:uncharacterized protein
MLSPEELHVLREASASKLDAMRAAIRGVGSALIAFSGGVDSTLVLRIAREELGDRAVALTALSAAVPEQERREAVELAARIGVRHECVASHELENPSYAQNPTNRCYFCKTELYTLCESKRSEWGLAAILDGFNADDFKDHRPGHRAAQEHRVLSPLAAAGLTKDEIRAWSFALDLPTWDKPQMPCLASRLPYGTPVTAERLGQVGGAEADLRQLGLRVFRVRHHGEIARLEVAAEELGRFSAPEFRRVVDEALKERGFTFVALDLAPFESGRLNVAAGIRIDRPVSPG